MDSIQTTSFTPMEILPAIELGKMVLDVVTENKKEDQEDSKFRITELPRHEDDFATRWQYASQNELTAKKSTIELNAAIQILEELENESIQLPDGFKGKTIAKDLKKFILEDFQKNGVLFNIETNLAHRAFYAHCTKRAISSLREGIFIGPDGYKNKHPEIADILEDRYREIIFENTFKLKKINVGE